MCCADKCFSKGNVEEWKSIARARLQALLMQVLQGMGEGDWQDSETPVSSKNLLLSLYV